MKSVSAFYLAMIAMAPVSLLAAEDSVRLAASLNSSATTEVEYQIDISGQIITPSPEGPNSFPLTSNGEFRFLQSLAAMTQRGPTAIAGIRLFESASTETTVSKEHVTEVALPNAYKSIQVRGSGNRLTAYNSNYLLTRQHLDLIQMPFDPMAVNAILPGGSIEVGDKWNTEAWLMPMLTGLETAIDQSATCSLKSVESNVAVIYFTGKISGAVHGSASNVGYSGELTLDLKRGIITSFKGQQKEKRTPGPVSPGLNITANIRWEQSETKQSIPKPSIKTEYPPAEKLQLVFQTPLRLQLKHSREWHIFHETPAVTMLRQIRNGSLVSQCNISAAITVPPKQHTPDKEFRNDVQNSVSERKGKIVAEDTVIDDSDWRVRHIEAIGDASGSVIKWDYYLCSATTGEQFSIVFSHSESDDSEFGNEAMTILKTLKLVQKTVGKQR